MDREDEEDQEDQEDQKIRRTRRTRKRLGRQEGSGRQRVKKRRKIVPRSHDLLQSAFIFLSIIIIIIFSTILSFFFLFLEV